jgi:hypothetical protein
MPQQGNTIRLIVQQPTYPPMVEMAARMVAVKDLTGLKKLITLV